MMSQWGGSLTINLYCGGAKSLNNVYTDFVYFWLLVFVLIMLCLVSVLICLHAWC